MAIHYTRMGKYEHVFTHVDPDTKEWTNFAVSRLRQYLLARGQSLLRTSQLKRDLALRFIVERGIEMHRVFHLSEEQVREPIILLMMDDGTSLTVDGHHRYIRRFAENRETFDFYHVPKTIWRRFVVDGLPNGTTDEDAMRLVNSDSGIK